MELVAVDATGLGGRYTDEWVTELTPGVILRLTAEDVWVLTAEEASKLIATRVFPRLATEDICELTAEKTSGLTVMVISWLITEGICELTARIFSRLTAELTCGSVSRLIVA